MNKVKEFVKKYHLVPYVIIILTAALLGYGVKWYNYDGVMAVLGGNTSTFYGYFHVIFALIIVGISVVYFLAVIKKTAIEKIYVVSAAFVGIIFMLIIPPYAAADEDRHIMECNDFVSAMAGYDMEGDKYHWIRECDADTELSRDLTVKNYAYVAENFFSKADDDTMVQKYIDDITYDTDNVIYYYPAITGIAAGRLLGLGTIPTYMLGRLFMLAMYVFLTYLAIRKMPVFKTGFALIMLMPSAMQRAAAVSYDGLLLAYIFLFVAYVVHYIYNRTTIKVRDAVVMAVSGVFMAVGKGGAYLPFLLMLFLVPKANFGTKIKYGFIVAGAILISLIAYIAFNPELFIDIAGSSGGASNELLWTEEEGYTLKAILTSPKRSLKVLLNTFICLGGNKYAELIGSGFGWLQIYVSDIWIAAYSILLAISVFNEEDENFVFNGRQKLILGITAVASAGLIILSMWMFWTPLNNNYVEGLQGRYFIPVLIPLFFILKNKLFISKKKIAPYMIMGSVCVYCGIFFDIWSKIKL